MKKEIREPSRHEIWKMFDQISPTYDCANRFITLGCDRYWRKKMIRFLPDKQNIALLDCATGTGDQILSLLSHCNRIEKIVGIDLSKEMLTIAQEKVHRKKWKTLITLQEASLLDLPFSSQTFDCVTISFGIRNVTDVMLALKETLRVLKPGGRLLILEGSIPENRWVKPFFLFYLRQLLPRIGGAISKNKAAYAYLNETIETFPRGESFCKLLRETGFIRAKAHRLTGGVVVIYEADKDASED